MYLNVLKWFFYNFYCVYTALKILNLDNQECNEIFTDEENEWIDQVIDNTWQQFNTICETLKIFYPDSEIWIKIHTYCMWIAKKLYPNQNITDNIVFCLWDEDSINWFYKEINPWQYCIALSKWLFQKTNNESVIAYLLWHELSHLWFHYDFGEHKNSTTEEWWSDIKSIHLCHNAWYSLQDIYTFLQEQFIWKKIKKIIFGNIVNLIFWVHGSDEQRFANIQAMLALLDKKEWGFDDDSVFIPQWLKNTFVTSCFSSLLQQACDSKSRVVEKIQEIALCVENNTITPYNEQYIITLLNTNWFHSSHELHEWVEYIRKIHDNVSDKIKHALYWFILKSIHLIVWDTHFLNEIYRKFDDYYSSQWINKWLINVMNRYIYAHQNEVLPYMNINTIDCNYDNWLLHINMVLYTQYLRWELRSSTNKIQTLHALIQGIPQWYDSEKRQYQEFKDAIQIERITCKHEEINNFIDMYNSSSDDAMRYFCIIGCFLNERERTEKPSPKWIFTDLNKHISLFSECHNSIDAAEQAEYCITKLKELHFPYEWLAELYRDDMLQSLFLKRDEGDKIRIPRNKLIDRWREEVSEDWTRYIFELLAILWIKDLRIAHAMISEDDIWTYKYLQDSQPTLNSLGTLYFTSWSWVIISAEQYHDEVKQLLLLWFGKIESEKIIKNDKEHISLLFWFFNKKKFGLWDNTEWSKNVKDIEDYQVYITVKKIFDYLLYYLEQWNTEMITRIAELINQNSLSIYARPLYWIKNQIVLIQWLSTLYGNKSVDTMMVENILHKVIIKQYLSRTDQYYTFKFALKNKNKEHASNIWYDINDFTYFLFLEDTLHNLINDNTIFNGLKQFNDILKQLVAWNFSHNSFFEMIHILDDLVNKWVIAQMSAEDIYVSNLDYIISTTFESTALQGNESLESLLEAYQIIYYNKWYETRWSAFLNLQNILIQKAINDSDIVELSNIISTLLKINSSRDIIFENNCIDLYINRILDTRWRDDGTIQYSQKINELFVSHIDSLPFVIKNKLLERLFKSINSQKILNEYIFSALYQNKISAEWLEDFSQELKKFDILNSLVRLWVEYNDIISFFIEPCNEKNINTFLRNKSIRKNVTDTIELFHWWDSTRSQSTSDIHHVLRSIFNQEEKKVGKNKSYQYIQRLFTNLYEIFWAQPLELRAFIINSIGIENSVSDLYPIIEKHIFSNIENWVKKDQEIVKLILSIYVDSLPHYQQSLFLSALLFANKQKSTQKLWLWETIAILLETLWVAEIKLWQMIHSNPSTPIEFWMAFRRLKSNVKVPTRREYWNELKHILPHELFHNIQVMWELVRASIDTWCSLIMKDGTECFITTQSLHVYKIAKQGYERLWYLIEWLKKTNKIKKFTEIVKIISIMEESLQQAKQITFHEIDMHKIQEREQIVQDIYLWTQVQIDWVDFMIDIWSILMYAERYKQMKLMHGVHFNDLPESNAEEKWYKKRCAIAILLIEFGLHLAWKQTDFDRHWDNVKIDKKRNIIWLYDFWWMQLSPIKTEEKRLFIDCCITIFQNSQSSLSVSEALLLYIESNQRNENEKIFLLWLYQRFLSLWDYFKHIEAQDLILVFTTLLKSNIIDQEIYNYLEEKYWFIGEIFKNMSTSFVIKKSARDNDTLQGPVYIWSPTIETKNDSMIFGDSMFIKKEEK